MITWHDDGVKACSVCGALVRVVDQELHEQWHARLGPETEVQACSACGALVLYDLQHEQWHHDL